MLTRGAETFSPELGFLPPFSFLHHGLRLAMVLPWLLLRGAGVAVGG